MLKCIVDWETHVTRYTPSLISLAKVIHFVLIPEMLRYIFE